MSDKLMDKIAEIYASHEGLKVRFSDIKTKILSEPASAA